MNKTLLIVLALVIVGAVVFTVATPAQTPPASESASVDLNRGMSYKEAKALPADTKPCAKANASLSIDDKNKYEIEMAAILPLIDVPAGTEVDVRIASYRQGEASGSAIYPGDYGSYNFTASSKLGSASVTQPSIQWQPTSLKPCSD